MDSPLGGCNDRAGAHVVVGAGLLALPAQASELGDLVKAGDVAGVTATLDKGAAIDKVEGVTALYIACETGNAELAKLLIDGGADLIAYLRTLSDAPLPLAGN